MHKSKDACKMIFVAMHWQRSGIVYEITTRQLGLGCKAIPAAFLSEPPTVDQVIERAEALAWQ